MDDHIAYHTSVIFSLNFENQECQMGNVDALLHDDNNLQDCELGHVASVVNPNDDDDDGNENSMIHSR